ncbi:MAG: MoaD/ThiS family protein [Rhodospirillales bacterium]|nr:MoaD/ThiS family protein [Rhodospirillales bacterium]
MARVVFTGNFRHLVGDDSEADIPASNVRDLLNRLGERYPARAPHLHERIAVALDGDIHQGAQFSPYGPDREV